MTSYNINMHITFNNYTYMHITLKGLFRKASPSRPCARAQNVVVVNGLVIAIHFDFDVAVLSCFLLRTKEHQEHNSHKTWFGSTYLVKADVTLLLWKLFLWKPPPKLLTPLVTAQKAPKTNPSKINMFCWQIVKAFKQQKTSIFWFCDALPFKMPWSIAPPTRHRS